MAGLRVLIADADAGFRHQVQEMLSRQGHLVVPAADGAEALARMQNGSFDVVVADVALAKQSGLELVRAALQRDTRLPVILLATADTKAEAAIGVRAGAYDFLEKPLHDLTRLAILIDRATGGTPWPTVTTTAAQPVEGHGGVGVAPMSAHTLWPVAPSALLDTVAAGKELGDVLELFAAELARVTRAAYTLVLLAHADGQLHLSAAHGYISRAEASRSYTHTIGEPFAWQIASAQEPLWQSSDSQTKPDGHATLGLPLVFAGQVLGIAIAHQAPPRETWAPETLAQAQRLAQEAAVAVELARLGARVKRLEPRDPITGLMSREYFFDLADRDFRRAWRFNQPLSAIVLDVDDFGKLHLLLGPREGDQVIRKIAHIVRTHVRSVDLVGRLDTDTIGLVLLMAKKEHGIAVAERLRRLIAELQVPTPDEDVWQITASFGVAAYPRENCASVFDLFALADQALRAAKRAGRNRVEGV